MIKLDGIWSFCADMEPKEKVYGDMPGESGGKLRVTAQIGGRIFAAPLVIPGEGTLVQKPNIDLPIDLLDGDKLEVTFSTNADYAENGNGSVMLDGAQLELYTPDGVTVVLPDAKLEPTAIGLDGSGTGHSVKLSFSLPQVGVNGARIVPNLSIGAYATPEKKRLYVSLDGREWYGTEIDRFTDGGEHDIEVDIPADKLHAGNVSIIVSSNIDSPGNMGSATLDLIHLRGGKSSGGCYIGNSPTGWDGTQHEDRCLMISLHLKTADGGEVTLGYSGGSGRYTCVIGRYMGGADFYHRQDFAVPEGEYVSVKAVVRAHVGADIRTKNESAGAESYINYRRRSQMYDLGVGETCRAVITLPSELTDESFAKLTVRAAMADDMPCFARVWVSVNSGAKRAAYAAGQSGRLGGGYYGLADVRGDTVELELPVKPGELADGENVFEFSADPVGTGKLLLCGNADGTQPEVHLTVYTLPEEGFIDAPVPATWETYEPDETGRGKYVDFDGVGWYRRNIELDENGGGYHALRFGGVDYYCEVWYDGLYLGSHEGGYAEFAFDIEPLFPDRPYSGELVVRVTDQSFDINDRFYIKETPAGFLQDTIGMNYAGIWQPVSIDKITGVAVCDLFPLPNVKDEMVELRVRLKNISPKPCEVTLYADVTGDDTERKAKSLVTVRSFDYAETTIEIDMRGCRLWEAGSPFLYNAAVTAESNGEKLTGASARFGMRSLETSGTEVLFNGSRLVLTGVLDWLFNFDIFSPAISPERFRSDLQKMRDAGFNSVKYCLVIPPEYMLDIHDEMGMYAYIEYPMWYERETPALFRRAYEQLPRLVCQNRTHPSLVMSDFNCELPDYSSEMDRLMKYMVAVSQRLAPNRLYLDNSSCGTQRYGDLTSFHPYLQLNRFADAAEMFVKNRGRERPMVFGEYADTDSVRDTNSIRERCGGRLPWWWQRFGITDPFETLKQQGISDEEIAEITRVSVLNAQEAKKYYIEETKKNPDVAALFITHKNDIGSTIPGFFDELGMFRFDADELSRSARENVLLLDIDSFNQRAGEDITASLMLAPNRAKSVTDGALSWKLCGVDGSVIASGESGADAAAENSRLRLARLKTLHFKAPETAKPIWLRLIAEFRCREFSTDNAWNLWVYPMSLATGKGLAIYDPSDTLKLAKYYPDAMFTADGKVPENAKAVLATAITPQIDEYLRNGGTLLYVGAGSEYLPVSKVYNWNAYSMPFIPASAAPVLGGVGERRFGCLDFLELFTEYTLGTEAGENVLMRRIEMRSYKVGSYITEMEREGGRLIQTTLRLGETPVDVLRGGGLWLDTERENTVGRYLLDRLIRRALGEI